jgi:chromosome partitioning protein
VLTIAVINQKGGSGKTTTATNLAAVWGRERNRSTLLVDLDPQFAATRHLGVRPADLSATLFDVLAEDDVDAVQAIVPNAAGVDLLAGDRRLAELELSLVGETMREQFLKSALEPVSGRYELCVLDCPPNLGLLTVNALVAAQRILVPVRMEDEGALQGVIELRATLDKLSRRGVHREISGVLRTVVDHRRQVYAVLNDGLRDAELHALEAEIPSRAGFHRQGVVGAPLVISEPDSAGACAYRALATELDTKLTGAAA